MKVEEVQGSFKHEVMIYSGLEDFLERSSLFIADSLESGEPIMVVVDRRKVDLLMNRFGSDPRARFVDMGEAGVNPGRIIPLWRDFVVENAHADGFRGIGEPVWAGRTPDELVECQQHEKLLNLAFEGTGPWSLMCPYDATTLPSEVIAEALASHPFISDGLKRDVSDTYRGADVAPFAASLDEPSSVIEDRPFAAGGLPEIRSLVRRVASGLGLSKRRSDELVLAVNELVTNSLRYGGGVGRLRLWIQDDRLVCEVSDRGSITDPLVGRIRPVPGSIGGYGLWMVNQLCDLVQVRSVEGGSVIRVHTTLEPSSVQVAGLDPS